MSISHPIAALALAVVAAAAAPDPGPAAADRARLTNLIASVYAPDGALDPHLAWSSESVAVFADAARTGAPALVVSFAATGSAVQARSFRTPAEFRAAAGSGGLPLQGLRVALDPGHIGGAWARTEERFFVHDRRDWFVQEAALNLVVARLLQERLRADGAEAMLVKEDLEPVTDARPEDFAGAAAAEWRDYGQFGHLPEIFRAAARADSLRKRRERMFYRDAEIAARAERVNTDLRPDLTLCLHFNAVETEDPRALVDFDGLAVFIHGCYLPGEVADPAQRERLFRKLLEGSHEVERAVAEAAAAALAAASGLGPAYPRGSAVMRPIDDRGYVLARNLAANRLIDGPVVFFEPYFMNSRLTYRRIQAGDYDGERTIEGRSCRSIFREYADAVAEGVRRAYAP